MSEWISVKDRLPEVGGYYLVVVDMFIGAAKPCVQGAHYVVFEDGGKFSITGQWPDSHVCTHWMPLPEPPSQSPKSVICPLCAGNPVDPKDLEAFTKEMTEVVIPRIVEAMKMRAELANESRRRLLFSGQP